MWSPSETKRYATESRVGAQQVGMAQVVTNSLDLTPREGAARVSHVDWPSLSLLPVSPSDEVSSSNKGFKVTVTVYPGEALFIPEGWYHQVRSEAGTVAVNYWFDGLASKVLEERPHSTPYLLRTLAAELAEQSRASLVHTRLVNMITPLCKSICSISQVKACRNQSKLTSQNGITSICPLPFVFISFGVSLRRVRVQLRSRCKHTSSQQPHHCYYAVGQAHDGEISYVS